MKLLAQEEGLILLEPGVVPGTAEGESVTFAAYASGITTIIFAVATALAVLMITIGGIEKMVSATPAGNSNGNQKITGAIIGLILLIIMYLILETVGGGRILSLDVFTNNLK